MLEDMSDRVRISVDYPDMGISGAFVPMEELMEAQAEIGRLKQWVADLQSGQYVNCVYCGHRYGPEDETPVSRAEMLRRHVEQCPEHPMSQLRIERDAALESVQRAVQLAERLEKQNHAALEAVRGYRDYFMHYDPGILSEDTLYDYIHRANVLLEEESTADAAPKNEA